LDDRDDFISEIRRILAEMAAFSGMLSGGSMPMPAANSVREPHEEWTETDLEYVITVETPGARPEDVHVGAGKKVVRIDVDETDETTLTHTYPFEREINPKELRITYKNGVLEVRAP
jgi:HSP20 family molecular chaperone IbpA